MVHSRGGRFRKHDSTIPGRPDLSNRRARLAVFVDGCFWHGCPAHYTAPATNPAYWAEKIARNRRRRATVRELLQSSGWSVIEIWECNLSATNAAGIARLLKCKPSG